MAIEFQLRYEEHVVREDIPQLSSTVRARIKRSIETKLASRPQDFGKPLRRSLRGYRKLRVGNYRVIFRIEGHTVKIIVIGHRSIVYGVANKRMR